MFLSNKYTNYYYSIINKANNRDYAGYTEVHHIIPKSMGGSNSKDNLVRLTGKEHFICHLLLTKMTEGSNRKKMLHAIWSFIRSSKNQQREKITGARYEKIRRKHAQMLSESRKGVLNVGRVVNQETRDKLSKAGKGKTKSSSTREKMKIAWTTRDRNVKEETRKKISEASGKYWKMSASREQQSNNRKNYLRQNPDALNQQVNNLNASRYTCECCGKITNKGNYLRWHGKNCKVLKNGQIC